MTNTQVLTAQDSCPDGSASNPDARSELLSEIDFKWLMTGKCGEIDPDLLRGEEETLVIHMLQETGWLIDLNRIHCDPSYAARLLHSELRSRSIHA